MLSLKEQFEDERKENKFLKDRLEKEKLQKLEKLEKLETKLSTEKVQQNYWTPGPNQVSGRRNSLLTEQR